MPRTLFLNTMHVENRFPSAKELAADMLDVRDQRQPTIALQPITILDTGCRGLALEVAEVCAASHISIMPALPPLAGT